MDEPKVAGCRQERLGLERRISGQRTFVSSDRAARTCGDGALVRLATAPALAPPETGPLRSAA
ncbi:MAG: hypothetical protein ABI218_00265 [Caldimonas sp.]